MADKTHLRAALFIALFAVVAALAIFSPEGKNLITGGVVSTGTDFTEIKINNNVIDGEKLVLNTSVTSLRITGAYTGNGSAKVYAVSGDKKLLVYEFKNRNIASSSPTGFVVFEEEKEQIEGENEQTSDEQQEEILKYRTENLSETSSEILSEPSQEESDLQEVPIVFVEETEELLHDSIEDNQTQENKTLLNQTHVSQESYPEDSPVLIFMPSENISGNETGIVQLEKIVAELPGQSTEENIAEEPEDALPIEKNDTLENKTSNESESEEEILPEINLTFSSDEALNYSELNISNVSWNEENGSSEFESAELNETVPEENESSEMPVISEISEVIQEIIPLKIESGCSETCSLFPFEAEYILFEISDGELYVENISYASPENGFYFRENISGINLSTGMFKIINLEDYFSGEDIFYDFTSSEGYFYEISGSSLKLNGLKEGVWMGKVYAVKDDVIIQSNEFEIIVGNPIQVNISSLLLNETGEVNVTENISENISVLDEEILALLNESLILPAEEPLPFSLSEDVQRIISENKSTKIRVIVKYKKNSNLSSLTKYVEEIRASSAQLLSENTILELQSMKEENYGHLKKELDKEKDSKNKGNDSGYEDRKNELIYEIKDIDRKIKEVAFAERILFADSIIVENSHPDVGIESVFMDVNDIDVLKNNTDIEGIYVDNPVSLLLDDSKEIIRINEAAEFSLDNSGIVLDGAGTKICFVDTGANLLFVNYSYGYDFVNDDSFPEDEHGHGTSVGYVLNSISPGAEIVAVKVINSSGQGYESDIIAGLQYCLEENADVVSLSIGGGEYEGYCDDALVAQKVNELADSEIAVFAATGNDGLNGLIKSPACARGAIRVGASTKQDALWGNTNYNNATLLLAPGSGISTIRLNGDSVVVSGTSMSAPMGAGAAALLLGADLVSSSEIYDRLVHTGIVINNSEREFARVDLLNALINNITNNLSEGSVGISSNITNETFVVLAQLNITSATTLCGEVNNYTDIYINGSGILNICPYNGTAGTGYVNISLGSNGSFVIDSGGLVNGSGAGGRGGAGTSGSSADTAAIQGDNGTGSAGISSTSANYGGGGGGQRNGPNTASGGGGAGFGGTGGVGADGANAESIPGSGGETYGSASSTVLVFGSGGGGSAGDASCNFMGAAGGAGFKVDAGAGIINISGTINISGVNRSSICGLTDAGGAGGGSGGHLILKSNNIYISGNLIADGGRGGDTSGSTANRYCGGGGGGGGRILIIYKNIYNSSMTYSISGGNAGASATCVAQPTAGNAGTIYFHSSLPDISGFSGNSSNFSLYDDLTNVSEVVLDNITYGMINWSNGSYNVEAANFSRFVIIGSEFIYVNATGLHSSLNSSANLTMRGLSYSDAPVIYRDGIVCSTCSLISYTGGILTFTVQGFSNYTVGGTANLSIWDDTDSQTRYKDNLIKFYANYTNKTSGEAITGAGAFCQYIENSTGSWSTAINMSYNSTSALYEYNKSFSSSGNFSFNVSCYNSEGYDNLSTIDIFNVTPGITCGTLSEAGKIYNLSENVSSAGTCFNITAANVTLDCQGYSINFSSNGLEGTTGVYSNQFNTTVKNCNIYATNRNSNDRAGILLYQNERSNLLNNYINISSAYAIYFYSTNFNNLINNTAGADDGNGIYFYNSENNNLTNNTFVGYDYAAIQFDQSDNNLLINNNATSYGTSSDAAGIFISYMCFNNTLNNNYVKGDDGGIIFDNTGENILNNNYAEGENGPGIYISGSYDFILNNNTALSNEDSPGFMSLSNINITISNQTSAYLGAESAYPNFAIYLANTHNSTMRDCVNVSSIYYDVYVEAGAATINFSFINCTYNVTQESVPSGSWIYRKWYYQAYANFSDGAAAQNINISVWNNTNNLQFSALTGTDGQISRNELMDYINFGGTRNRYSNYTVNATYNGVTISRSHNISNEYNIFEIFTFTANDTQDPTYSDANHNNTVAGLLTKFSLYVNDDTSLHPNGTYIFSTNNSGIWVNDSPVNFSTTPSWANVTKTLTSTSEINVGYMWYLIDKSGKTNTTPIYNLTTFNTEVHITDPTTVNPENAQAGDKLSIYFNYSYTNSTQITSGVTINNVTIGGLSAPIYSAPLNDTEGFEGSFIPTGWQTGGDANWHRNTTYKAVGTAAAGSGIMTTSGTSKRSWINYSKTYYGAGYIWFTWNVSSEAGYDFLCFCIDKTCGSTGCRCVDEEGWGNPVNGAGEGDASISSSTDGVWRSGFVNTSISTGSHTFLWCYAKDPGGDIGQDMGIIDNITFYDPTNIEQYAYENNVGWQINVTVPSGLTGYQDLFLNATYAGYTRSDTEEDAIDFNNYNLTSNCGTLSDANGLYRLTNNVSSTETCINITAANVTLDCYGYSINYSTDGAENTYGIYTNNFNTTIRNCRVLDGNRAASPDSRHGIYLEGSENSTLYNNFVNASNSTAIYLFSDANFNILFNNIAASNGSQGIFLYDGSSYNVLSNNTAISMLGVAMFIYGYCTDNNFTNNTAITFGDDMGIYLASDSDNNIFINNTATSPFIATRFTGDSSNNTFIGHTSTVSGPYADAVYIYSSNNNTFRDCKDISGTEYSVALRSSSINNTFINCSYDFSIESVEEGSELIRKWYFDANVTNTIGSVLSGANLSIYNSSSELVYSELTNSTGDITRTELIEYITVGAATYYHTNHTVNTILTGYNSNSEVYNITAVNNIFANIVLEEVTNDPAVFSSYWNTSATSTGSVNATGIRLPLYDGGTYNFTVYWGDGNISNVTTWNSANRTHYYDAAGVYNIIIAGTINGFRFANTGDRLKLYNITQWGNLRLGNDGSYFEGARNLKITATDVLNISGTTYMHSAFMYCSNLTSVPNMNSWDTSGVDDMSTMFAGANNFNQDIGNWNTSSVTTMDSMFNEAHLFNQNLSNWNTSSVTAMDNMFWNAYAFNGNITEWDTSNVQDMSYMFLNAADFNQDISGWDTGNVTLMYAMFEGASSFNQPIEIWDMRNVTNIATMFYGASSFNRPIGNWNLSSLVGALDYTFGYAIAFNQSLENWDVSRITDMNHMFNGASSFNGNITGWNTSSVTDMSHMFERASSFNQDIGGWDTSNVVTMDSMFEGAFYFNQDITDWDTGNVNSMYDMFYENTVFDQNISKWDIHNVTTMNNMFGGGGGLSVDNYNALLISWAAQEVQDNVPLEAGSSMYTALASSAREHLVTTHTWEIYDSGELSEVFIEFSYPTTTEGLHVQDFIIANVTGTSEATVTNITVYVFNDSDIIAQNSSSASSFYWNISGLEYGTYYLNATVLDSGNLSNQTETRTINLQGSIACGELSTAGETFNLESNLSSSTSCFNITSQNITLDCQGYWISYTGADVVDAFGVYSNQYNTTIINCNIDNFTVGIYYDGVNNGTVQDSNVSTYNNQIVIEDVWGAGNNVNATAILHSAGTYSVFSRNYLYSTYGEGILILAGYNNTISDSVCNSTYGIGIYLEEAGYEHDDRNLIINSIGYSNFSSGIAIYTGGNNTLLNSSGISILGDGIYSGGIYILYSTYNSIINSSGIALSGGDGISVAADYTIIRDSYGHTNGSWMNGGIHIWGGAYVNLINSTGTSYGDEYSAGVMIFNPHATGEVTNSLIANVSGIGSDMANGMWIGGYNNTFANISAISEGYWGLHANSLDYSIINNLTAYTSSSSNEGVNLQSVENNTITNINTEGSSSIGVAFLGSINNTLSNSRIVGNGVSVLDILNYEETGSTQNRIINNTFISSSGIADLIYIDTYSDGNFFYWNNFTSTSGYYVNDEAGSNTYNTSVGAEGEGNVWHDIIVGTVAVLGENLSVAYPSLYRGISGEGYPYNGTTSNGKVSNNVFDYAPLTNVNDAPPEVTINYPSGTIADVTPLINVSLNRGGTIWYSLDGGANVTLCTLCTSSQTEFLYAEEGSHTIYVYANDSAGNLNDTVSSSFTINMNNNYYDTFNDSSSIQSKMGVSWYYGNITVVLDMMNIDDLVSIYTFENSSDLGIDAMGNNNMDSVVSDPAQSATVPDGFEGYSIDLDGDDQVCINSGFTFNPSADHTMCFWVRKTDLTNDGGSSGNVFAQNCYYDTWGDGTGSYEFTANNCDPNRTSFSVSDVYTESQWTFICQTYNSSNYNTSLYVNGTLANDAILDYAIILDAGNNWCLGGCDGGCFMEGQIYSPMWISRIITPEEIETLAANTGGGIGNFTSYPINTSSNITLITDITWTTANTNETNNMTVQVSADGGTTWYNATNGQGLSQTFTGANNSLVYRVLFNSPEADASILDMNITWSNMLLDTESPTITFEAPTPEDEGYADSPSYVSIVANISDDSDVLGYNTSAWIDFDGSLVGYWSMDYYNSSGIYDNSSYENFAKFEGGADYSDLVEGIRGQALYLDGGENYLYINDSESLNLSGDFTISAWVYNEDWYPALQGNYMPIIEKGEGVYGTTTNFDFGIRPNEVYFYYKVEGVEGGDETDNDDLSIFNNQWQHVVAVYSDLFNNTKLYIDGTLIRNTNTSFKPPVNGNNITIGGRPDLIAEYHFNGSIDEVMIFNRSLTANEVLALYDSSANKLNATFENLSSGQHNYTVYAVDTAGNINSSGLRTFNINTNTLTSCDTLSTIGATYVLGSNVSSIGTCINITAANVTLDCQGYWINYSTGGVANNYGVYSAQFNATIKNCNIIDGNQSSNEEGRYAVVLVDGASNSTIINNTISTGSSSSLVLYNEANYNNITSNTISSSGGSGIFSSMWSFSNIFSNNVVFSENEHSIYFELASNSVFLSNNLTGLYGAYFETSEDIVLINNSINATGGGSTLFIYNSPNATLINNNLIGNGTDGHGLTLREASDSTILGLTAKALHSSGYGINVYDSDNIIFRDCVNITALNDDVHIALSTNITFVNCSYNISKEYVEADESELIRKWYFVANVTNTTGSPLDLASVNVYDVSHNGVYSELTDSGGNIGRTELIEYVNIGGLKTYSTSHTVNVSKIGYLSNSTIYNISNLTNVFATFMLERNSTELIECGELSSANTIYTLGTNVSSNGTCFNVNATNITLDCQNNWIIYSTAGSSSTYGVYTNQYNTTVKNCNVLDGNWTTASTYRYGIYFFTNDNSTLQNNFVNTSNSIAINIESASNFNNITNNTGTSGSNIGILLDSSSNNTLTSNTGISNSSIGIYLNTNSGNNILTSNNGTSNTDSGISLQTASNNILVNNTGKSTSGLGLFLYQSSNNNISLQTIRSINVHGIYIEASNHTSFRDCINISAGFTDVVVDSTAGSVNNTFINCSYNTETLSGAGNYLIRMWYFDANVTNTSGGALGGAAVNVTNRTSVNVYSNTTGSGGLVATAELIEYINVGGTRYYPSNYTVNVSRNGYYSNQSTFNLTLRNNSFVNYTLYTLPGSVSNCGTLWTANTEYILVQNVSATGTCFNITAANVTLDCQGYSINFSSNGLAGTTGVYSNQFNTTIKNCNIADGNWTSSETTRYAVTYQNSDNGLIVNNSINTSNSNAIDIRDSSQLNNITLNRLNSASGIAVYIQDASNNIIDNNNISSSSNFGLELTLSSINNNITNNLIVSTSNYGADISSDSSYNIFTGNSMMSDSGNGFNLGGAYNNSFIQNTFLSNEGAGIDINSGSEGNLFLSNIFSGNNIGIFLQESSNNLFKDCVQIIGSNQVYNNFGVSVNNTFVNCSYETESIQGGESSFIVRKWYYRASTNYTNGTAVVGANISAYNTIGNLQFTELTNSSGEISRKEITDYVNNGGIRDYYSNYTFNASYSIYNLNYTHNITDETNIIDTFVFPTNAPPQKVVLVYPGNGNDTFYERVPTFVWEEAVDPDDDEVTYQINVSRFENFSDSAYSGSGISNTYKQYDLSSPAEMDFDEYYWRVRAYDGQAYGEWSNTSNFTLGKLFSITLLIDNITFVAQYPNMTNSTENNETLPFLIQSNSNTHIRLHMNVSGGLWQTQPLDTEYWQMKVRQKDDGSFDNVSSMTSFFNVTNVTDLVRRLNYSSELNNVSIDIKFTVPMYEPPGQKISSIDFVAQGDDT